MRPLFFNGICIWTLWCLLVLTAQDGESAVQTFLIDPGAKIAKANIKPDVPHPAPTPKPKPTKEKKDEADSEDESSSSSSSSEEIITDEEYYGALPRLCCWYNGNTFNKKRCGRSVDFIPDSVDEEAGKRNQQRDAPVVVALLPKNETAEELKTLIKKIKRKQGIRNDKEIMSMMSDIISSPPPPKSELNSTADEVADPRSDPELKSLMENAYELMTANAKENQEAIHENRDFGNTEFLSMNPFKNAPKSFEENLKLNLDAVKKNEEATQVNISETCSSEGRKFEKVADETKAFALFSENEPLMSEDANGNKEIKAEGSSSKNKKSKKPKSSKNGENVETQIEKSSGEKKDMSVVMNSLLDEIPHESENEASVKNEEQKVGAKRSIVPLALSLIDQTIDEKRQQLYNGHCAAPKAMSSFFDAIIDAAAPPSNNRRVRRFSSEEDFSGPRRRSYYSQNSLTNDNYKFGRDSFDRTHYSTTTDLPNSRYYVDDFIEDLTNFKPKSPQEIYIDAKRAEGSKKKNSMPEERRYHSETQEKNLRSSANQQEISFKHSDSYEKIPSDFRANERYYNNFDAQEKNHRNSIAPQERSYKNVDPYERNPMEFQAHERRSKSGMQEDNYRNHAAPLERSFKNVDPYERNPMEFQANERRLKSDVQEKSQRNSVAPQDRSNKNGDPYERHPMEFQAYETGRSKSDAQEKNYRNFVSPQEKSYKNVDFHEKSPIEIQPNEKFSKNSGAQERYPKGYVAQEKNMKNTVAQEKMSKSYAQEKNFRGGQRDEVSKLSTLKSGRDLDAIMFRNEENDARSNERWVREKSMDKTPEYSTAGREKLGSRFPNVVNALHSGASVNLDHLRYDTRRDTMIQNFLETHPQFRKNLKLGSRFERKENELGSWKGGAGRGRNGGAVQDQDESRDSRESTNDRWFDDAAIQFDDEFKPEDFEVLKLISDMLESNSEVKAKIKTGSSEEKKESAPQPKNKSSLFSRLLGSTATPPPPQTQQPTPAPLPRAPGVSYRSRQQIEDRSEMDRPETPVRHSPKEGQERTSFPFSRMLKPLAPEPRSESAENDDEWPSSLDWDSQETEHGYYRMKRSLTSAADIADSASMSASDISVSSLKSALDISVSSPKSASDIAVSSPIIASDISVSSSISASEDSSDDSEMLPSIESSDTSSSSSSLTESDEDLLTSTMFNFLRDLEKQDPTPDFFEDPYSHFATRIFEMENCLISDDVACYEDDECLTNRVPKSVGEKSEAKTGNTVTGSKEVNATEMAISLPSFEKIAADPAKSENRQSSEKLADKHVDEPLFEKSAEALKESEIKQAFALLSRSIGENDRSLNKFARSYERFTFYDTDSEDFDQSLLKSNVAKKEIGSSTKIASDEDKTALKIKTGNAKSDENVKFGNTDAETGNAKSGENTKTGNAKSDGNTKAGNAKSEENTKTGNTKSEENTKTGNIKSDAVAKTGDVTAVIVDDQKQTLSVNAKPETAGAKKETAPSKTSSVAESPKSKPAEKSPNPSFASSQKANKVSGLSASASSLSGATSGLSSATSGLSTNAAAWKENKAAWLEKINTNVEIGKNAIKNLKQDLSSTSAENKSKFSSRLNFPGSPFSSNQINFTKPTGFNLSEKLSELKGKDLSNLPKLNRV